MPAAALLPLALKYGPMAFSLGKGALSLIRGGKKATPTAPTTTDPRAALLARLSGQANQPLESSTLFQTGLSRMQGDARDAAAGDAAMLATRGMAGSESDIALRSARGKALAGGTVDLLGAAAQDRTATLDRIAGLGGQLEQEKLFRQQLRDQKKGAMWGAVGNLAGSALTAWATRGGQQK